MLSSIMVLTVSLDSIDATVLLTFSAFIDLLVLRLSNIEMGGINELKVSPAAAGGLGGNYLFYDVWLLH